MDEFFFLSIFFVDVDGFIVFILQFTEIKIVLIIVLNDNHIWIYITIIQILIEYFQSIFTRLGQGQVYSSIPFSSAFLLHSSHGFMSENQRNKYFVNMTMVVGKVRNRELQIWQDWLKSNNYCIHLHCNRRLLPYFRLRPY